MRKKIAKISAILLAASMLMTACGTESATQTGSEEEKESSSVAASAENTAEPVEITFAHWGGDGTYEGIYKARVESFMADNPDVKVNVLTVADDYETKIQTMLAAHNAPDVMQVAENGAGFASKNAFVDLTSLVEESGMDLQAMFGDTTEEYTLDGQLFGIPDRGGCSILYYNKDIFDDAQIAYPDENWTLDDYFNALEKMTKDTDGDGVVDQWGATSTHYQAIWGYMLQANGGNIIKDGQVVVNSPENLDTLTRYNEAYQNGWIVPYEELERTSSGGDAYFLQGKLGMNITGMWNIAPCSEDENLNFDIAPVPKGIQEAGWPMGSALTIYSESSPEKQAAAWKFIQYMTSAEQQKSFAIGLTDCPANLETMKSEEFLNQQINGKSLNMEAIGTGMSRVTVDGVMRGSYYQEVIDETRNQMKEMLLGRLTAEQCLETMQKNLEDIMSNYE